MISSRPTPYSIGLAALISMHCEEDSPLYMTDIGGIDIDFHKVDSFLQGLILTAMDDTENWSHMHDTRVCELVRQFRNSGVRFEVGDRYRNWLHLAAASIDALTDLMATIHRCVMDGTIDTSSTNGIYIRSVCLGFDALSFESTTLLWKDFRNEVNEAFEKDVGKSVEQEWTFSPDQMEDIVRRQCWTKNLMSKKPSYVTRQLNRLVEHNPELPSAHFMRFLLCMEAGERVGAVDALHRYVDYVLINTENHVVNGISKTDASHRNEEILQFAAILKAALHSSFGDRALALACTEEAVRIAQQSQDSGCVAFALGWLAMHETDSSSALELIKRCIHRATEANLCSLSAGANLTLAGFHGMINHRPNSVSNVQGSIDAHNWNTWSDALSGDLVQSTDVESTRWDHPANISHINSMDEALDIMGRQNIVAASIWDGNGQVSQSSIASLLSLYSNGKSLSNQDIRVTIQNIGRRALVGSPSILCYKMSQGRTSLYNQLRSLDSGSRSDPTNIDVICVYGDALRQMVGLCDQSNLGLKGFFSIEIALVVHEWAVRRGELCQAEAVLQILRSELNSRIPDYDLVYMDILCQEALLRSRQGRFDEAKDMLMGQLHQVKSSNILKAKPQVVRLLLLLSLVHLEASNQQQCTSSFTPLSECLGISKDCGMEGLYAVGLTLFAQIYLRRGNYQRCIAVIQGALPTLLQQEHVWYQAEAYLVLGKCYLKKAKRYSDFAATTSESFLANNNVQKILKSACQKLHRSETLFRRCQDMIRLKEVYYLLARTYHEINGDTNVAQRDDAAQNFIAISQYLTEAVHQDGQQLVCSLSNSAELQKLATREIQFTLNNYV